MKKLAVLSVILALIVTGCVQRVDFEDGPPVNVNNDTNINNDTKSGIVGDIGISSEMIDRIHTSSGNNIGPAEWCVSGDKITISREEFTVVGIVTHENRDNICKAERITLDNSSIIYYNEGYITNGKNKFFEMRSSGKSAKAEAIVTVEG